MFDNPIEIYKRINRFAQENGMVLDIDSPGKSVYTMTVLDKHLSSPNVCHGGVVAGFMDSVMGSAALSISFGSGALVSTVEFKINYFLPVFLSDSLIGRGSVDYEGKKLISATGEIFRIEDGKEVLIAKAIGTFNKYPIEKTQFLELFNI